MKNIFFFFSFVAMILFSVSCQKMERPALGNYPKDTNPPDGPLRFYVAFDGSTTDPLRNAVDSIRANFASTNSGSSTTGIAGKGYQGGENAFVQYVSPNDFANYSSFTISLWIKKTPQAAGKGTNFAFALNSKDYSWTNLKMFFEFEDAGQSTTTAAAGKFYLMDQWFEYTGAKAMANVLNGQWHHLVFAFDGSSSTLSTYIDGVAPGNLPAGFGKFNGGKLNFYSASDNKGISGFTIGGPGSTAHNANTWMNNFDGQIDQFRLYNKALTAGEVTTLYNSKL